MVELLELSKRITNGESISKKDAKSILEHPIEELCNIANAIRKHYCANSFDMCSIINAKSGKCSEDCKFCAQSIRYKTDSPAYELMEASEIVSMAERHARKGVQKFSIVTSGKRLTEYEVDKICEIIRDIRMRTSLQLCVSLGLISKAQFQKLNRAGISRVHNNIESSSNFYPQVCTTHSYLDKLNAIKTAQESGMDVCSGGIIGLGENFDDRIQMAIELRSLGILSIPINILMPIKGTPYEYNNKLTHEEILRTIALFRFICPTATIRLAGGRSLLDDKGRKCLLSGANAAITGEMLTTSGISIDEDLKIIHEAGYVVGKS